MPSGEVPAPCGADRRGAKAPALVAVEGLGRREVAAVWDRIRGYIRSTPVLRIDRSELGLSPGPLVLKLEQLQHAGSFKARGAFANLLLGEIPEAGVVAASGGNHGAAVAYAARRLGIRATIFVPEISSPAKLARIESYGARLSVGGANYDEARAAAAAWSQGSGALDVPAFDSLRTILGAGSLGLELAAQAPEIATVLAAVGGGGLLAGIAASYERSARVVGVEPVLAPTMTRALEAGKPVDAEMGGIAVDSLAPRQLGETTFAVLSRFGAEALLVDDDAIRDAQRRYWEALRLVVEPGAAAPLAALCSGRYQPAPDEVVGVVLSGANTTAVDLGR